jgi:subtilisin family serine protease
MNSMYRILHSFHQALWILLVVCCVTMTAHAQVSLPKRPPLPEVTDSDLTARSEISKDVLGTVRGNLPASVASATTDREGYFRGAITAGFEYPQITGDRQVVELQSSITTSGGEATVLGREAVRVEPQQLIRPTSGDQSQPAAISDPQNNLYVAYEDHDLPLVSQNGDTTFVEGIRIVRSTDGGQTWSYFLTLGNRDEYYYKPSIAYAQGFIFVAFRGSKGGVVVYRKPLSGWSGAGQFTPQLPVTVSRGTTVGSKWVMDVRLVSDAKTYESLGTSALYLSYVIGTAESRFDYTARLYMTRSLTLGTDWTPAQTLVDDGRVLAFNEYRAIGMDFGGGLLEPRLYIAYAHGDASNNVQFRLLTSSDFGVSFSSPTILADLGAGYYYSIDVASRGGHGVALLSKQGGSEWFGYTSAVLSWYTTDGGASWNYSAIAGSAAHADAAHDGAGNFYVTYLGLDRVQRFELGDGTPRIGSLPVELSQPAQRGTVFDTDPGIAGFWSGAGAISTYTVTIEPPDAGYSYQDFSEIAANRIVPVSEPDISLAPTNLEVFQAAPPPARIDRDRSWESSPGRVIVALEKDALGKVSVDLSEASERAGVTSVTPIMDLNGGSNGKSVALTRGTSVVLAEFDAQLVPEDVAAIYESYPGVLFAEPDYVYQPFLVPNDPLYQQQWGLNNREQAIPYPDGPTFGTWGADIDAERAWNITTGSASVTVAVVDDGVDAAHPDFTGRVLPGYDFANDDTDASPGPDDGHGTAVAGIIAAAGNNGIGVAGVAWNVNILPVKVFDGGSASSSVIARAVKWSADQGAHIINMSLGGPAYSQLLELAVDYAHGLDALVISAAGNFNLDNRLFAHYPAGYRNSMSIGALSPCNTRKRSGDSSFVPDGRGRDPEGMSCDEEFWWGSHFGDLDLLAPGTRIHTTDVTGTAGYAEGDYMATFNRTSAATPFAAGVAALVRSVAPDLTNEEVRAVLQLSAEDMGAFGWDADTGHGRLSAYRAVLLAQGMETPGEVLVYNRGTQTLNVSVSTDRPWLQIVSAPSSIASGSVGGIEVAVNWSDPAFASGLPISAGIEIISNDPDEQQLGVTLSAVPSATDCRRLWTVPITVSGSAGTLVTQLGEGVNATDGLDAGCGEGPSTDGNTAFQLPTGDLSRTDIRNADGEQDWTLALSGSTSYELSWAADDLPDGTFFMTVGPDEPLDMRATESVSITDPSITSVSIVRSNMVCLPFARSHWQQRTLPVKVADASVAAVFPRSLSTFEHRGQYREVSTLIPGHGYAMYLEGITPNDSGLDTVCGEKVPEVERHIDLVAGWNLIGTFEEPVGLPQLTTDPPGLLTDSVRVYWNDSYVAIDSLFPTVAYWVLSTSDGVLRYAEPSNASTSAAFVAEPVDAAIPVLPRTAPLHPDRRPATVEIDLSIRAAGGSSSQLTFGLDPCASNEADACTGEQIVAPFSPDSSDVDARFIGRTRFVETTDWVAEYAAAQFGYVDIRRGDIGANRVVEHFFRVKWPSGETTLTFEWNLPVGATARLAENVDEDDGEIPGFVAQMSGLDSATLTDPSIEDFRLTVTYEDVISTNNVRPSAIDDDVITLPSRPITVFPMFNDDDADGDPLTLLSYTQPRHGTATSPRPDAILYTPNKTFTGTDSLYYVVRDPAGGLDTATVRITVTEATGNPPVTIMTGAEGILGGTRFSAALKIGSPMAPIEGLAGVAVELRYDPQVLSLIPESILEDRFLGPDLVSIDPAVDPVAGTVSMSLARRGGGTGASGEGVLARMTFDVLPTASAGPTLIEVTDALAVDSLGNEIPLEHVAGTIEVVTPRIVWPGLTGLDSIVESTDVFPIADCYGLTGPTRPSGTTIDWEAVLVMPWYFPAGDSRCSVVSLTDPGAADTNGDGIISEEDLQAILANFRLSTSGKSAKTRRSALDSVYVPVSPVGTEYEFDLSLGTSGEPFVGTVGFSARLVLPPGVLSLAGVDAGSTLDDGDLLKFTYSDPATGAVETALVRKRGSDPISAEGVLARMRVQVASSMTEPAKITLDALTGNVAGSGPVEVTTEPAGVSQPVVVAVGDSGELPVTLGISSVYPNPFQTSATAAVEVPQSGHVRLALFDVIGRLVAVPFEGQVAAGRYRFPIRIDDLPSGTYFVRLESQDRKVAVPVSHVR